MKLLLLPRLVTSILEGGVPFGVASSCILALSRNISLLVQLTVKR